MATPSIHSRATARRYRARDPEAIRVLKQDHREVEKLFDEYEQLEQDSEKLELFNKIAVALKIHCQIEEEIFYPAERGEVEEDLLDEAVVEHAGAKDLIAQIEGMKPGEELYDAKVKVLGEYVKHHVKEEEGDMFRQAKKADLDLNAIGQRLAQRKQELTAKLSAPSRH